MTISGVDFLVQGECDEIYVSEVCGSERQRGKGKVEWFGVGSYALRMHKGGFKFVFFLMLLGKKQTKSISFVFC